MHRRARGSLWRSVDLRQSSASGRAEELGKHAYNNEKHVRACNTQICSVLPVLAFTSWFLCTVGMPQNESSFPLAQVEDKVNSTVSTAWGRLTDFTRSLLHSAEQIQLPSHVERSQDGQYLPADSIVNYALIFNQLRKPGGAVGR